MLITQENY
jgi:hypothetical protein